MGIDQTGHAKKQSNNGISGTVVVVACCFSGKHAPFFVFAITYEKELELPAINVVK